MGIPSITEPVTAFINGDFSSDVGWFVGRWWEIAAGIARVEDKGPPLWPDALLAQSPQFQANHLYRFRCEILDLDVAPNNGFGVWLFDTASPVWNTPGIKTFYHAPAVVTIPAYPVRVGTRATPNLGDWVKIDDAQIIDITQHILITYGFNAADITRFEFYHLVDEIYMFIISNFETPMSVWFKVDLSEF